MKDEELIQVSTGVPRVAKHEEYEWFKRRIDPRIPLGRNTKNDPWKRKKQMIKITLYHKPHEVTLSPRWPHAEGGRYLGGWKCTYRVLSATGEGEGATGKSVFMVRDLYAWEKFSLWLDEKYLYDLRQWWYKRRFFIKRDNRLWIYLNPGVFHVPLCPRLLSR